MKALSLLTVVALFSAVFAGCVNEENKKIEIATGKTTDSGQPQGLSLNFKNPVIIDSTGYVMYPLAINKATSRADYSKLISGSAGRQVFWNIVFYDMIAKTYHLIDDKRKMVITSYSPYDVSSYTNEGVMNINKKDDHIFYSVIVDDYNKDGNLDLEDPTYLFISDKKGNNFKQISPNNVNVSNWTVVKSSGKVLINIVSDNNTDKKFDEDDDSAPYIYDLKAGGIAQPILSKDFTDATIKLFEKHWQIKSNKN
jgi:hypothetical protein